MESLNRLNLKTSSNKKVPNSNENLKMRSKSISIGKITINGILEDKGMIEDSEKIFRDSVEICLSDAITNNQVEGDRANVLRDITNFKRAEDIEKTKCWNNRKKNELARERWKMLAKALIKPKKVPPRTIMKDISVRRFTSFDLITSKKLDKLEKQDGCWLKYTAKVFGKIYFIEIYHLVQKLTPKDLIGFNNTGNICIWPSEEILTFYLLSNIHLFEGKETIELGGGMTCLAGLMLAKYGKTKRVDLTDGNVVSVENVQKIIWKNALDKGKVSAFQLDWMNHQPLTKKYDFVLSSDCLFFDETRSDLVDTIWHSLKDDGIALVMAPKRGNTLDSFVKVAARKGFYCILQTYYEKTVWKQHMKFKKSRPEYDENLHYPILILLTKSSLGFPFLFFSFLYDVLKL